jgi:hypothetical protein
VALAAHPTILQVTIRRWLILLQLTTHLRLTIRLPITHPTQLLNITLLLLVRIIQHPDTILLIQRQITQHLLTTRLPTTHLVELIQVPITRLEVVTLLPLQGIQLLVHRITAHMVTQPRVHLTQPLTM